jgi:two-component system CheB/CheR fusion protein
MATRKRKASKNEVPEPKASAPEFPIVGVGASAGGIEALTEFLRGLGPEPGVATIIVQHQEKKHVSQLTEVLARATSLPVTTIDGAKEITVNHVYVAPAEGQLMLSGGKLELVPNGGPPIDRFLRSLAEDQGSRAIGVILSGAASDGTLGVKAIKADGGITFAQDGTAKFDEMPRSAIASGAVDLVLPASEIAREIVRIAHTTFTDLGGRVAPSLPESDLRQVFEMLRKTHEVDFTHYKPTTVERRIRRRMVLHKLDNLADYIQVLRDDPTEIDHLYSDILIRVTGFFRDPAVFAALQRDIVPRLLANRSADDPVRVWVPGCATGEEAYSIAMAFSEVGSHGGFSSPIQIFGTDIAEASVEYARLGVYPENIVAEVSPERLRRFFTKTEGGYRISKSIRDCCVFARQNVTKDPPLSKLDLISCRNVMIYLGSVLQRRALTVFHYALRPRGYLLLGSSETVGNFSDLFAVVDRKHKFYQKKGTSKRPAGPFEAPSPREEPEARPYEGAATHATNVFRDADRILMARFAPAGVLINENLDIVQFRGRTSTFLEPAPGTASFNVLKMAREGLLAELRAAINTARRTDEPVRRERVRVWADGHVILVNIEAIPFSSNKERYQLILFEENAPERKRGLRRKKATKEKAEPAPPRSSRLKRELDATRDYLQSIIEEQEAMNEELRSANEEIQSSNEELQSTNEELETAKEELQSSNEELTTLNEELENRNQELADVDNDLLNLLASVDIPIVMLDSQLRIRQFNLYAQRVLNLIPTDVGRPIADMNMNLEVKNLSAMVADVVDNLEVQEMEVRDRDGHRFLLRIRPYKTMDNKIDGAVLVLIDIEELKKAKR